MNVLVLPNKNTSFHHLWSKWGLPCHDLRQWRWRQKFYHLQYEWLYISDITEVNSGRTSLIGELHPLYLRDPETDCTNPSAASSPTYDKISVRAALKALGEYQALVCSIESALDKHPVYVEALKHGLKVLIVDHPDHEDLFTSKDELAVTRGLKKGADYHTYFKKDLPLRFAHLDRVRPLAPDPIRFSVFPEGNSEEPVCEHSVFFSGVQNKPFTYENRFSLLREFSGMQDAFLNIIDVDAHYSRSLPLTNSELISAMQKSHFILSPAGRAWTTTRHTMAAITHACPIMPSPDCVIVGPEIENGTHAIMYPMLRYLGPTEAAAVAVEVRSRVESTDDSARKNMSKNWRKLVEEHHTTSARARYILSALYE